MQLQRWTRLTRLGTWSLVVVCLAVAAARLAAYPEPALVNPSWQLDVRYEKPRVIAVQGLDGRVRWYWYMTYKVVNLTGAERLFVPSFTIATDQGDLVRAGEKIPAGVFEAVLTRLNNPLIEHPLQVSGRILLGEDQARESFAVWPWFEHDVDEMDVFIAGLAGETQTIAHPLTGEPVELRKTLMLTYRTPGTGVAPERQPIELAERRWIMR